MRRKWKKGFQGSTPSSFLNQPNNLYILTYYLSRKKITIKIDRVFALDFFGKVKAIKQGKNEKNLFPTSSAWNSLFNSFLRRLYKLCTVFSVYGSNIEQYQFSVGCYKLYKLLKPRIEKYVEGKKIIEEIVLNWLLFEVKNLWVLVFVCTKKGLHNTNGKGNAPTKLRMKWEMFGFKSRRMHLNVFVVTPN